MKLKELIDRIQTAYSKGVKSDDSRLSNRYIYSKILSTRSRIISQQYKKKQTISQWGYQTLPCVKLIEVPAHQCPCLPPMGCTIMRSEYRLPEPVMGFTSEVIQNVSSIDRSMKIDRVSINSLNSQKGNKYTSKKIGFFIQEGYLYISTPVNIGVVSLVGVFEDPIKATHFESYCDKENTVKCIDYLEEDFPIDRDLVDTLIELTAQEVIGLFSQGISDASNNANDNTTEQSR